MKLLSIAFLLVSLACASVLAQQKKVRLPEPQSVIMGIKPRYYECGLEVAMGIGLEENKNYKRMYAGSLRKGYKLSGKVYELAKQEVARLHPDTLEAMIYNCKSMLMAADNFVSLFGDSRMSGDSIRIVCEADVLGQYFWARLDKESSIPKLKTLVDKGSIAGRLQLMGIRLYDPSEPNPDVRLAEIEKAIGHVAGLRTQFSDEQMNEWLYAWRDYEKYKQKKVFEDIFNPEDTPREVISSLSPDVALPVPGEDIEGIDPLHYAEGIALVFKVDPVKPEEYASKYSRSLRKGFQEAESQMKWLWKALRDPANKAEVDSIRNSMEKDLMDHNLMYDRGMPEDLIRSMVEVDMVSSAFQMWYLDREKAFEKEKAGANDRDKDWTYLGVQIWGHSEKSRTKDDLEQINKAIIHILKLRSYFNAEELERWLIDWSDYLYDKEEYRFRSIFDITRKEAFPNKEYH